MSRLGLLPNGSRLSCSAPAGGRSEIHKRARCTLGHKRNSAKTGRRQLQALVRQRLSQLNPRAPGASAALVIPAHARAPMAQAA